MILPSAGFVLNVLGGGNSSWHHSILDLFSSGVKCAPCLVTSRYSVQKCLSTHFILVQMFGRHRNMLCLLAEYQHLGTHCVHTFLNRKCSCIILSVLPTFMHTLHAISHTAVRLFSRISSLTQRTFTLLAAHEHVING